MKKNSTSSQAVTTLIQQAIALQQQARSTEAELLYQQALKLEPKNPSANYNLGLLELQQNKPKQALTRFKILQKTQPKNSQVFQVLASAYEANDQIKEAISYYIKALSLDNSSFSAQYNLGSLMHRQGDLDFAERCYLKALNLQANFVEAHVNLGLIKIGKGELDFAIEHLEKAITLKPEHIEAHYNLSLALLLKGEYKKGWQEHEWRIKQVDQRIRSVPFTQWQDQDLTDKNILVFAEQGVGDEVMFASCIPELQALQSASIQLECDPRLTSLFKRSFPKLNVHGHKKELPLDWHQQFPDTDFAIPIGSLPLHFRKSLDDFPKNTSYLKADPVLVEEWEERFNIFGEKARIGISWRGGATEDTRAMRSTVLTQWSPIFKHSAAFVNLQYGDCDEELQALEKQTGMTIHNFPAANALNNLEQFSAQISALDLVISIDNSTVHFAGAMGIPTWVLLPCIPEFRWQIQGQQSPWYHSARIFRQSISNTWQPVFEELGKSFEQWLEQHSLPSEDKA